MDDNRGQGEILTQSYGLDAQALRAGLCAVLPEGIILNRNPFTPCDFIVTGRNEFFGFGKSRNMRAIDKLLFGAISHIREAMHPEGTLYVVCSENYAMPIHSMAQAGLAENSALRYQHTGDPRWKPLYVMEAPYNMLAEYARIAYDLEVTDHQRYGLHEHDPLGHIFARAVIADNLYESPGAKNRRFNTIVRHGVPMALMDAARKNNLTYLDERDPLAVKYAQKMFGYDLAKEDILLAGNQGMEIRNAVMAERSIDAAKESGIVVIGTGADHIGTGVDHKGNLQQGLPFETSLPKFLAKQSDPHDRILSILFTLKSCGYTSKNITPPGSDRKIIPMMVRGISEKIFGYHDHAPDFMRDLGRSYGANIPDRFAEPYMNPDAMRAELVEFLNQHPCT